MRSLSCALLNSAQVFKALINLWHFTAVQCDIILEHVCFNAVRVVSRNLAAYTKCASTSTTAERMYANALCMLYFGARKRVSTKRLSHFFCTML